MRSPNELSAELELLLDRYAAEALDAAKRICDLPADELAFLRECVHSHGALPATASRLLTAVGNMAHWLLSGQGPGDDEEIDQNVSYLHADNLKRSSLAALQLVPADQLQQYSCEGVERYICELEEDLRFPNSPREKAKRERSPSLRCVPRTPRVGRCVGEVFLCSRKGTSAPTRHRAGSCGLGEDQEAVAASQSRCRSWKKRYWHDGVPGYPPRGGIRRKRCAVLDSNAG